MLKTVRRKLLQFDRSIVVCMQQAIRVLSLYHFPPPFTSVSVAIVENNTILLIKRNDGNGYSLPGGYVNLFEKVEDAAAREVREETGLTIQLTGILTILSGKRKNTFIACTDIVYRAHIVGNRKTSNSIEGSCIWMPLDKIEEHAIAFDYYNAITLLGEESR